VAKEWVPLFGLAADFRFDANERRLRMFHSFRRWFSIQMAKNAHLMILLGIVVFNVLLWLVASLAAFLVDKDDFPNYGTALAGCIAWLLDPGTYESERPFAVRFLSVLVIVTAMVTFSGGIIAYVANVFSAVIEKSKKGRSQLFLKDHIVILNWNSEAPEIIADFLSKKEKKDIVILSSIEKESIEGQIKNKALERGLKTNQCEILIRTGSVFSEAGLKAIMVQEAKTIIILRNEGAGGLSDDDADILSLKAMMMALSEISRPEQTIIIEVAKKETAQLIQADPSHHSQVLPIIAQELMGNLIAQTILVPKINEVYDEIFSYHGVEFYEIPTQSEKEALQTYSSLIPLAEKERTFALAENKTALRQHRKTVLSAPRLLRIGRPLARENRNVVVFGKSSKKPYLEESIRRFSFDSGQKTNISFVEETDPQVILRVVKSLTSVDTILLLSDDSLPEDRLDSNVLFALLLLKEVTKERKIKVIVEILNQRHQEIPQRYDVENVIVSTKYVSHMITQISDDRNLFPLFKDLLTYDETEADASCEIYTYDLREVFPEQLPLRFASIADCIYSVYASSSEKMVPIGLIKKEVVSLWKGNLEETPLILEKGDRLIVIDR
jgi:ion channel POLLUX/CASTOR